MAMPYQLTQNAAARPVPERQCVAEARLADADEEAADGLALEKSLRFVT